ncbi:hypothetical protein NAL32_20355 [Chryseobacterium sp. Ch-15]|uniref:Uncharacterized protein n=1 Tax=Chryseobacterium muglaense TaxID=2893752 RepID=A0A9Q3YR05_9FLAO|nr:hypothetical protein [Chryseobacterium muglaense]MBD3906635.1 hypothetical protein [Chryseobacterium muglaense]MCC9034344.1 hypothetical protein [Chryseobacterium muglaense]MCM2556748.1 hypothetical protein [Chryseobacterium muglaense]
MKILFTIFSIFLFSCFFSQNNDIKSFNLNEFNKLSQKSCYQDCEVETFGNKNYITFKRNDSVIDMSYHAGLSNITKRLGNYYVTYDFHPNLKIKSKKEFISAISRMGTIQVGKEVNYDENGEVKDEFDYDTIPYDDKTPGPKRKVWEILKNLKQDFGFDALLDKNLFSIIVFQDEKTKKINYSISKFINDNNNILKTKIYIYEGDTAKNLKTYDNEWEIPDGLRHY